MEIVHRDGIGNDSDSSLVAGAKRGNTQAFEELVFRYERRVLAIAQRITNNREDAEDVAQESRLLSRKGAVLYLADPDRHE